MGSKARNYTPQTLKQLYGLSGNQCAFPGCTKQLVNKQNALDSNICHIEAAKEDGQRFNALMSDEQRADYPNLILLCVQHHDETNDVKKYTVDVLREMKSNHESTFLNQRIKNNPSMLSNTINAIANIKLDEVIGSESLNSFNPKNKISFNELKRNIALINEYKVYNQKINSLYDELELQGSIKKERLLDNIKQIYLKVKGIYVKDSENEFEIIKQNSDNIIDDIFAELYLKMEGSAYWDEDIILGIRLIMVDAFMRCKILEEPV